MTHALAGSVVGNGHCVAYVRHVAQLPHTSLWRRGVRVREANPPLPAGAPIATFDGSPPRYQNRMDGSSHAAVLIATQSDGLLVWDQWLGQPVAQRVLRFRGGEGPAVNDGDRFYAIEPGEPANAIG